MISFSEAYASCDSFIPVIHNIRAYDEASAVFFGTVIESNESSYDQFSNTEMNLKYTTFAVHHIFKGNLDGNKVSSHNSSVGYDEFIVGGTYFVYAFGSSNEVNICTAPIIFPLAIPTLIFHFPFLLIPLGIIFGIVIVWRKIK